MKTIKRSSSGPLTMLTCGASFIALFLLQPAAVKAQWTTPDASQNINNTNTGNVGIGTTTPTSLLEVKKSQNAGTIVTLDNPFTTAGHTAYSGVLFKQAGVGRLLVSSVNDNHSFITSGTAQFWNFANGPTVFATNNTEQMRITATGFVGIGLTAPLYRLDVNGGTNAFRAKAATTSSADAIATFENNSAIQMIVRGNGNIGVGNTSPTEKLHVTGNIKVSGNIDVGGNINAKYQDVAEWVESSQELTPGTVVVLDSTKSNQVVASTQSYDSRVAGVISLKPGIALGDRGEGRVLVAATGRVKVKVDASNGPIQIGDLLVTAGKEGFAMKSVAVEIGGIRIHRPGTLIGKALEPLASGTGEILVLLSLQ